MGDVDPGQSLDLSSALPLDVAEFEILHPATGKPTGWVWELAGPAHPKSIEVGRGLARDRLRKEARLEAQMANGRKVKPEEEEPEARKRRNVENIVARVIGWSMKGPADEVGQRPVIGAGPIFKQVSEQPIAFTENAAIDLLQRPDMGWLLNDIVEYLASEQAFMQSSAQD